ncbi:MAG TPA: hypothetical protein VKB02_13205 [Pyrinomonadaceae bacterium]|nr:hypothetical protein [Pyrinomonadaceae bacterium]
MELFERFEVNHEPRWQVLTKLVGASLVLHLVFLWMVVYVPAFRNTLNIAALVASTTFVDRDYEATQIRHEVQMVQLEKFRYPDGYFAVQSQVAGAVPGQPPAADPFAPRVISQASKEPKIDPEASPSPSPEPSVSPTASPVASPVASASPSVPAIAQASPSSSPLTPEEAQKQLEKTAEQNNITLPEENQINKKPLKDLAAHMNELKTQGKLDLNKPFEIIIEAELDEKGKLVNARFRGEGDEVLQGLFTQVVAALNDSGLLIFLRPISQDNPGATVRITVKQGEKEVLATVESEASSPPNAEKLARDFNNMLSLGAWARAGKDEAELMKNSTAKPDGKKVAVNFSMPRQTVVDMINKQLKPGV